MSAFGVPHTASIIEELVRLTNEKHRLESMLDAIEVVRRELETVAGEKDNSVAWAQLALLEAGTIAMGATPEKIRQLSADISRVQAELEKREASA